MKLMPMNEKPPFEEEVRDLGKELLDFYLEDSGRPHRLSMVLNSWGFDLLEDEHDYIQWLFPLPERSKYNPGSPILTREIIKELTENQKFKGKFGLFRQAQETMLDFYGIKEATGGADLCFIGKRHDMRHWLTEFSHNHLRISRIIKSVSLLESQRRAVFLMSKFVELGSKSGVNIESIIHWKKAALG